MSNSSLVTYTRLSPHYDSREGTPITDITIHHMAGNLTVYQCGEVFQTREASANYGIDGQGRVGLYVDEKYASWANANAASNRRSITIELANDEIGGDWHVSDTAIEKCIELCVDICKRNGISEIRYTGDTSGNLTRHNMFYATGCPGPYLQSKFPYIASEINRRLTNAGSWKKEGSYWYYYKNGKRLKNAWAQDSKGLWYWLGSDGKMATSKTIDWNGSRYYLKSDGSMAKGWVKFSAGWKYFSTTSGKMYRNEWKRDNDSLYYFKSDGIMATGKTTAKCDFGTDGKLRYYK